MRKLTFIICLMLAGCTSLTTSPTQEITVTSNPPGATVTTTIFEWTKTPGVIEISKANSTILTATLFGYETQKVEIKASLNPLVFGNSAGTLYPWPIMGKPAYLALPMLEGMASGGATWCSLNPTVVHFELEPTAYTLKKRQAMEIHSEDAN